VRDADAEARLTDYGLAARADVRRIHAARRRRPLARTFARLSEQAHPWADRAVGRSWSGAWASTGVLSRVIAATPRLDLLEVRGTGALAEFPHRT